MCCSQLWIKQSTARVSVRKHFLQTQQRKWPKSVSEIQRNIRKIRVECHIPLQLTEPVSQSTSYQEVIHNRSKLPETQSQTFCEQGGGGRRKLCRLSYNDPRHSAQIQQ